MNLAIMIDTEQERGGSLRVEVIGRVEGNTRKAQFFMDPRSMQKVNGDQWIQMFELQATQAVRALTEDLRRRLRDPGRRPSISQMMNDLMPQLQKDMDEVARADMGRPFAGAMERRLTWLDDARQMLNANDPEPDRGPTSACSTCDRIVPLPTDLIRGPDLEYRCRKCHKKAFPNLTSESDADNPFRRDIEPFDEGSDQ